jgi:hypothetical protein
VKYLYRILMVAAVAFMLQADIEKKGSFDLTNAPEETSVYKKGSFDDAKIVLAVLPAKKGSFDLTGKDPEVPVDPK